MAVSKSKTNAGCSGLSGLIRCWFVKFNRVQYPCRVILMSCKTVFTVFLFDALHEKQKVS